MGWILDYFADGDTLSTVNLEKLQFVEARYEELQSENVKLKTENQTLIQQVTEGSKTRELSDPALDDRFKSKWSKVSANSILVLACLIDEGGTNVSETAIRSCLREKRKLSNPDASGYVRDAGLELSTLDLIKRTRNLHASDEMSLNPTWESRIKQALQDVSIGESDN